jgi:pyrroloquinoline quinone biosynthesis protein B
LHPNAASLRGTPISAVLLTNADLDHIAGLFSLREGGRLSLHATKAVRESVDEGLRLTSVLNAFCGLDWIEPPVTDFAPLGGGKASPSSLAYRAIPLPGGPPIFSSETAPEGVHSVAYYFEDSNTGGRLLVAPDVAGWTDALTAAMAEADAVLFDGTFWSEDELQRIKPAARTATQMGHLTIKDGSLAKLSKLPATHRAYIHINNTNPVLAPGSPERAAVDSAGIVVGYDGLEFEI